MFFYFFFQAEDGIRDGHVTGVQTCALPISSPAFDESAAENMSIGEAAYAATFFLKTYAKKLADPAAANEIAQFLQASGADWRSEERRVGKECRARWKAYIKKKKTELERADK